jgi:HD superfamily phosphodiesterase
MKRMRDEGARGPEANACAAVLSDAAWGRIFGLALPYLQTRHNEAHTKISCAFALRLLAEEEADPQIVIPAVLLHDVGWSSVPEDRQLSAFGPKVEDPELTKVHEREGAALARAILVEVGCPPDRIHEITEIIVGHDTRPAALGREDALVKDADKLFRISQEGFAIDCRRFGLDPAKHLAAIERRIDEWFFTGTGKRLAREEAAARWRELRSEGAAG